MVGGVKFRQQPVGYDVLSQLETEAPLMDWTLENDRGPEYRCALFNRSGFKRSVEEAAEERNELQLFAVGDVVGILTSWTVALFAFEL